MGNISEEILLDWTPFKEEVANRSLRPQVFMKAKDGGNDTYFIIATDDFLVFK